MLGVTHSTPNSQCILTVACLAHRHCLFQDLSQFFTDTMNKALHMNKNDHVITVYLNLPRRFAFVEFRTPELAAAGLQLDGKQPKATNHSAVRPPSPTNPAAALCVRQVSHTMAWCCA